MKSMLHKIVVLGSGGVGKSNEINTLNLPTKITLLVKVHSPQNFCKAYLWKDTIQQWKIPTETLLMWMETISCSK